MYRDMESLNTCSIGAKSNEAAKDFENWELDGSFTLIGYKAYVYLHTFHATFSSIKFSQLVKLWNILDIRRWDKDVLAMCEIHDTLLPFSALIMLLSCMLTDSVLQVMFAICLMYLYCIYN